jgi:hypothetical protein
VVIAIQTFGDFLLLGKGKITEEVVKLIMSWRHSGFIRLWMCQKVLTTDCDSYRMNSDLDMAG